jgi:hypothetical protein
VANGREIQLCAGLRFNTNNVTDAPTFNFKNPRVFRHACDESLASLSGAKAADGCWRTVDG